MRSITASTLFALMISGCTLTTLGTPGAYIVTSPRGDACGSVCGVPLGCRVAVHRMYNPGSGEHFYTSTRGEGASGGFNEEGADYFHLSVNPAPGLVPLHRCMMNYGKHFYTTAPNCEGVTPGTEEGTLGYLSPTPRCGSVPLYRSYNPGSRDHFYTIDAAEHARATQGGGYTDEGITGYVWLSSM